jgi:hypothetical protein
MAFREGARKSDKVRWIAVAAARVLVVAVAVWAWLGGRGPPQWDSSSRTWGQMAGRSSGSYSKRGSTEQWIKEGKLVSVPPNC